MAVGKKSSKPKSPPKKYLSLCSLVDNCAFEIHEYNITDDPKSITNLKVELFRQAIYHNNLLDRSFRGKTCLGDQVYVYIKRKYRETGIKIGDSSTIIIHKQSKERRIYK